MTQSIVVLDRDGVINEDSDAYIKSADEWRALPGSIEAIASLSKAGHLVAVATNQSGLGRGLFDEYALAQMHDKMHALVEAAGGMISAVCFCPHEPGKGCKCRKPATGMLEQIQDQLLVPLSGQYFIGDSEKDLVCAMNFGMRPVLVRTGKGSATEDQVSRRLPDLPVFNDLAEAVAKLALVSQAGSDQ